MKEYQTFIVRIWADDASDVARGHIQHVRTRRTLYFKDAGRMLRFIDEHLAPLSLTGQGEDGSDSADQSPEDAEQSASVEKYLSEKRNDGAFLDHMQGLGGSEG